MAHVKCPQCGQSIDTLDGYCQYCGYTIEEEPAKPAFSAPAEKSGEDGEDESSNRSPVIGRDDGYIREISSGSGISKGLIFNIGYLAFAAICVILLFVPFATLTDKDKTRYTIFNSNIGVGLTIIAVAVLGFVFSFIKRKRVVILITGIGLAGYGLYSFYAISNLAPKLEKIIKAMQALEDLSAMIGGTDPVKVTFAITPVYYIFAVCAILAGGLAAMTFITTTDDGF